MVSTKSTSHWLRELAQDFQTSMAAPFLANPTFEKPTGLSADIGILSLHRNSSLMTLQRRIPLSTSALVETFLIVTAATCA